MPYFYPGIARISPSLHPQSPSPTSAVGTKKKGVIIHFLLEKFNEHSQIITLKDIAIGS